MDTSSSPIRPVGPSPGVPPVDPTEPIARLLRDLRATPDGLTNREAARRLISYGPNQLHRRRERQLWRELGHQLTHPLALLLWPAAALVYLPPLQAVFGTVAVDGRTLLLLVPMPFIVWGADETQRYLVRCRRASRHASEVTLAPSDAVPLPGR